MVEKPDNLYLYSNRRIIMAKLKDLVKENFSLVGGLITTPALNRGSGGIGLSDIVEDIYGTQEKVSAKEIKEAMGTFSKLGNLLHREENLKEIASSLSEIATKAKTYTLSETDDWFDKVTVNRNMKELTTLSKSFGKFAQEAQGLQERMSALYEDMGHIIGRYYEVNEESGDKAEYEKFFNDALKKHGVASPDELGDEAKAKFFNYVDKNWQGDNESD